MSKNISEGEIWLKEFRIKVKEQMFKVINDKVPLRIAAAELGLMPFELENIYNRIIGDDK